MPVSSTVIPLTVLEVSYGLGGKPSEEYKEAYLKKLLKKVQHDKHQEDISADPDTLITSKFEPILATMKKCSRPILNKSTRSKRLKGLTASLCFS